MPLLLDSLTDGLLRPRSPRGRARALARQCDHLGAEPRLLGLPIVENRGRLHIGAGLRVDDETVRLRTGAAGSIAIGDDCRLGAGVTVVAHGHVKLGSRVWVGPEVTIADADLGDPDGDGVDAGAIEVGTDVVLEPRATLLKGARIGAGARVQASAVVASAVPPGATVAGNPARIVAHPKPHNAHQPLEVQAWLYPHRPAILNQRGQLTYGQLWQQVAVVAGALHRLGLAPGTAVLCGHQDSIDFVVAVYACWFAGMVAVPVARHDSVDEVTARAARVAAGAAIGVRHALGDLPTVDPAASGSVGTPLGVEPHAAALILFTSGTTAAHKAVVLSHRAVLQATANINTFMQLRSGVRELVAVPLHHSFGLGRVRCLLATGGTIITLDGPLRSGAVVDAMERYPVRALSLVPAGLRLLRAGDPDALQRLGGQLEYVELGSASMTAEEKAQAAALFPRARVCMHYGLTEASRSTFLEFHTDTDALASVGRPSPNVHIDIVDAEGQELKPGEAGQIAIRGAHLFTGYRDDRALTASVHDDGGRFLTGDRGFIDADGNVHLLGRIDDLINRGGVMISPHSIELAAKVLGLQDYCVIAVTDAVVGEVPALAFTDAVELSLPDVQRRLADVLPRASLPAKVIRVQTIPRTQNGKPRRQQLAQMVAEHQGGGR